MEIPNVSRVFIPERGISVALHPKSAGALNWDKGSGEVRGFNCDLEAARVATVAGNKILRSRYPTAEVGSQYMKRVCPEWRRFLMDKGVDMTGHINKICNDDFHYDTSIAIFGSNARGLTKRACDSDPSNIDICVLGPRINRADREIILNAIRPYREHLTTQIHTVEQNYDCPDGCRIGLNSTCRGRGDMPTKGSGSLAPIDRVGVHVMQIDTMGNNGFSVAVDWLISSFAVATHDPLQLWENLEDQALKHYAQKKRGWVTHYTSGLSMV